MDAQILADLDRSLLPHVVGEDGIDVLETQARLIECLLGGKGHHRQLALVDDLAERRLGGATDVDRSCSETMIYLQIPAV